MTRTDEKATEAGPDRCPRCGRQGLTETTLGGWNAHKLNRKSCDGCGWRCTERKEGESDGEAR